VRADRHEPAADLPAGVAAVGEAGLAEQLGVVVDQPLRVLGTDQDAVEIHGVSF